MNTKLRLGARLAFAAVVIPALLSASESRPIPNGEIHLPLDRYDSLLAEIERAEQRRAEQLAALEDPSAERTRVEQRLEVRADGTYGAVTASIRVAGRELRPVPLPLFGLVRRASVTPEGATLAYQGGLLTLLAERAGVYEVDVETYVPFADDQAALREVHLISGDAPVSSTTLRFDAALQWQTPGATVVRDEVEGSVREVELSIPNGQTVTLELRDPFDSNEAEKAVVRTLTATVLDVQRQGIGRTDIAIYDVVRGQLSSHSLELPSGLQPESIATDEGTAQSSREGDRLTVYRQRLLRSAGVVNLHTPLGVTSDVDLQPVETDASDGSLTHLSHYLVARTHVAADVQPPADRWQRRDVSDLPPALATAVGGNVAMVWQLQSETTDPGRLAVRLLPEARDLGAVVRRRESTSLLTASGSLVHRDFFHVVGRGSALRVTLPQGSELWSLLVDGSPTRPLESAGSVYVPLSLANDGTRTIELVSVQSGAVPQGRSEIAMTLATLDAPVLEHRWRLLLPEGRRYRFAAGDLRPTRDALSDAGAYDLNRGEGSVRGRVRDASGYLLPGVTVTLEVEGRSYPTITDSNGWFTFLGVPDGRHSVRAELIGFGNQYFDVRLRRGRTAMVDFHLNPATMETITVTSEAPLLDEMRVQQMFEEDARMNQQQAFKKEAQQLAGGNRELERIPTAREAFPAAPPPAPEPIARETARDLAAGRAGGVRPLPVDIPDRGKLLQLIGILPPEQVNVVLEVKEK